MIGVRLGMVFSASLDGGIGRERGGVRLDLPAGGRRGSGKMAGGSTAGKLFFFLFHAGAASTLENYSGSWRWPEGVCSMALRFSVCRARGCVASIARRFVPSGPGATRSSSMIFRESLLTRVYAGEGETRALDYRREAMHGAAAPIRA